MTSQSARQCSTVVRATHLVNGTPRFLDPQKSGTPEPIDIKLDGSDYVVNLTPHANFGIFTLKEGAVFGFGGSNGVTAIFVT